MSYEVKFGEFSTVWCDSAEETLKLAEEHQKVCQYGNGRLIEVEPVGWFEGMGWQHIGKDWFDYGFGLESEVACWKKFVFDGIVVE